MNKRFCVFFLLIPFVFYSQKAKDDNLPPQCDISSRENYIVKTTVTKEDMLDDPKFINQLKERLIAQISSFVSSELTISSSILFLIQTDVSTNIFCVGLRLEFIYWVKISS